MAQIDNPPEKFNLARWARNLKNATPEKIARCERMISDLKAGKTSGLKKPCSENFQDESSSKEGPQ